MNNFTSIRNITSKLNSYQIFILSFLICLGFYSMEWLIGIDRFYHPDSLHYLSNYQDFNEYIKKPSLLLQEGGYYIVTNLLGDNYFLLILLNFTLYSLTNILIYQKIFKKFFNRFNDIKLLLLFYILFLDPYRLHLASHVLKETFIILFMTMIIITNIKLIKILGIFFLDIFRNNSWIYLLVFLTQKNIKRIFDLKYINFKNIFLILFVCMIIFHLLYGLNISYLIENSKQFIISKAKHYHYMEMPLRPYDNLINFKEQGFPLGFILKNICWPILLISGFFLFFVSDLFKLLGLIIILNHFIIFVITKKTFISLGLIIILIMISIYTSSFTAMFRYSYVALYSSIIYFFLNLNIDSNKLPD